MRFVFRVASCVVLLATSGGCYLSRGADTPLTAAVASGRMEEVKALLAKGVDPNQLDSAGSTPLMIASRRGRIETIDALIEAGADPNLGAGVNGWTPMMHAIHKGQTEALKELLRRGADCNARSDHGVTALIMASGNGDVEAVRTLLDAGADPRAEARGGVTALTMAVSGGAFSDIDRPLIGRCQPEIVRALLEKAPDLEIKQDFGGHYARFFARLKGCSEVLSLLGRRAARGRQAAAN